MPRKMRPPEEEKELDLVPIMNLVLILIPLLLLSVVFLEITVINVTMPQKSLGQPQKDGEPPKRLQVMVSKEGFWVITDATGTPRKPIPECSGAGGQQVTICLKDPNVEEPTVSAYRWTELYNMMMELKSNPSWSDHETIELVAGSDIPFGIMVKAMDVTRYQRAQAGTGADKTQGDKFDSLEGFESSELIMTEVTDEKTKETGLAPLPLFPLVVLGVPSAQ